MAETANEREAPQLSKHYTMTTTVLSSDVRAVPMKNKITLWQREFIVKDRTLEVRL